MNNLTIIGGHVLLPHQADWSVIPKVSRIWRSPVDSSLDGQEDRTTARSKPWLQLSYNVLPFDHIERARFDDRFSRAMKAGKVAVPLWGRGVTISASVNAGGTTLTMSRADHGFIPGTYIFIQLQTPPEYDSWDYAIVAQTSPLNSVTVVLTSGLVNSYPALTRVWPLLFGRPISNPFGVMNLSRSRFQVALQFDGRAISSFAYDNFETYEVGVVDTLSGGEGWDGPWVINEL